MPRTSFCNSQQHRVHLSPLSQTPLECFVNAGREVRKGLRGQSCCNSTNPQRIARASLVLALLWNSCQLFPSLCQVSLQNLQQHGLWRWQSSPSCYPTPLTFPCSAVEVHNPCCAAPAAVPGVLCQGRAPNPEQLKKPTTVCESDAQR